MSLLAKNLRSNKAFLGSILSYMRLGVNSTSMLYKGHFINTSS
jgi:hypothetical protein